mmetsp:Transcript_24480/g.59393  ORF Transcript_24480/g.59393 Transcript_24480/m.59393 type:complete len:289 (+) Transcript_24480:1671-2537(+)
MHFEFAPCLHSTSIARVKSISASSDDSITVAKWAVSRCLVTAVTSSSLRPAFRTDNQAPAHRRRAGDPPLRDASKNLTAASWQLAALHLAAATDAASGLTSTKSRIVGITAKGASWTKINCNSGEQAMPCCARSCRAPLRCEQFDKAAVTTFAAADSEMVPEGDRSSKLMVSLTWQSICETRQNAGPRRIAADGSRLSKCSRASVQRPWTTADQNWRDPSLKSVKGTSKRSSPLDSAKATSRQPIDGEVTSARIALDATRKSRIKHTCNAASKSASAGQQLVTKLQAT